MEKSGEKLPNGISGSEESSSSSSNPVSTGRGRVDDQEEKVLFKIWRDTPLISFEMVKALIPRQNYDLYADNWHLLKRCDTETGQTFYLKVDSASAKQIQKVNYQVYLGLGRVRFIPIELKDVPEQANEEEVQKKFNFLNLNS